MFDILLIVLIVGFALYVYCNEKAIKKGKMPFCERLKHHDETKSSVRESAL